METRYISLNEAIDTAKFYEAECDPIPRLIDSLNAIQPADVVPGPRWIPVKERLPETDGNYLVWMRWPDDEEPVVSIINFDSTAQEFGEWEDYYDPCTLGWAGSDFMKIENVYAWMPLPEPPKEGG